MEGPLFSVLIAHYNNEIFFSDCYNSILQQTHSNWEIILVDDSSTIESREFVLRIIKGDDRVKFFINDNNKGCGYTKRKCAEKASGEFCGFVDPDDTLELNAIEIMVEAHQNHPRTSLIYSTHYLCDENLNVREINQAIKEQPNNLELIDAVYVGHFATYKNKLYAETEGIDPVNLRAVDHDLYYALEEVGNLLFINEPLYYYRMHSGSISLNDNNAKAHYWDWVIRHKYAIKRGRNLEDIYARADKGKIFLGDKYRETFYFLYNLYLKIFKGRNLK